MNKKFLAISIILVLTVVIFTSVAVTPAKAQANGGWITQYQVQNSSTHQNIITKNVQSGQTQGNGEILQGDELEVTVTISIGQSSQSSLTLTTDMLHSQTQENMYWQLDNNYSLGNFNPNSQNLVFPETSGDLQITCFGLVPSGVVTQTGPNGMTLDVPTPLALVVLKDSTGATLDQVKLNITDSAIDSYLSVLNSKQNTLKSLKSSGVDSGFIQIYENVISASEVLESQGFASAATQMLNGLNVSSPPSAATTAIMIPLIAVVAVVAAVFAFMFIRVRGKVSYMQLVVEDQIKDLEGLSMRIQRIDRAASSNLESVKDRLKRLVGA